MNLKIGDDVICKRNYSLILLPVSNNNTINTIDFIKGQKYTITDIDPFYSVDIIDCKFLFSESIFKHDIIFNKYFYTKDEIRLLKFNSL